MYTSSFYLNIESNIWSIIIHSIRKLVIKFTVVSAWTIYVGTWQVWHSISKFYVLRICV